MNFAPQSSMLSLVQVSYGPTSNTLKYTCTVSYISFSTCAAGDSLVFSFTVLFLQYSLLDGILDDGNWPGVQRIDWRTICNWQ